LAIGGHEVGASPWMTSSSSTTVDVDPSDVDRILKDKRNKLDRRSNLPLSRSDSDSDLHPVGVIDNEVESDDSDLSPIHIHSPESTGPARPLLLYQWVLIMEHQRGFTLFKTPHYSQASLLPNDLPPFQVYDILRQGPWAVSSLDDYTLPSPLWIWISRFWMVDMRGDGEVDANGWQYGRTFGSATWRPHPKPFSRGGWVRRRRWVRLMTKPVSVVEPARARVFGNTSVDPTGLWRGDADDWTRCRHALKSQTTDGQRLDLWKAWLRHGAALTNIQDIVRSHMEDLLRTFIYPESRMQFLRLLKEMESTLKMPINLNNASMLEFWSYLNCIR